LLFDPSLADDESEKVEEDWEGSPARDSCISRLSKIKDEFGKVNCSKTRPGLRLKLDCD